MKKRLTNILLVFALVLGLGLLLYPTVSDYYNSYHQSRAIQHYAEEVSNIDTERYGVIFDEATAYNARVAQKQNQYRMTDEDMLDYEAQLDLGGDGIMGSVEIPAIDCSLPIYHSTSDAVLQFAIGHVEWSSLPVGGESTHAVLSGHRGLPSAKLFTNLDKLQVGDVFHLHILDETLSYEVDQIRIVEPEQTEELTIVPGQDYVTLVTCTPYGINTHRLLVRGHRVETARAAVQLRVPADAVQIEPFFIAPLLAAPFLLLLLLLELLLPRKKRS